MLADLKKPEIQGKICSEENFNGYEMKWRDDLDDPIEPIDEKQAAKPKEHSIPTNLTEIAGKKFVRREL